MKIQIDPSPIISRDISLPISPAESISHQFNTNWKKSDFQKINRIGVGGFGEVWLVREISSGNLVAMKEMKYYSKEEKDVVDNEVRLLRESFDMCSRSNSQFIHIVQPLGFFLNDKGDKAFLVLEYFEKGDLQTYIKDMTVKGLQISDEKAWQLIGQIGSSLYQMHINGIIHGDLKPSNILLTNDYKVKLADFGLARELQDNKSSVTCFGGTQLYFTPEILRSQREQRKIKQSKPADLWACGVMLFELLAHKHPFSHGEPMTPAFEIMRRVETEQIDHLPSHYPESMKSLIMQMLVKDPSQRITAEGILNIPEVKASLLNK